MALTKKEKDALIYVSKELQLNPEKLYRLIQFESRWNPKAKNPYSTARGILQFTNKSAKDIGYSDSTDLIRKNPTRIEQLINGVLPYLKKHAPFPTDQSLAMSVFYPTAMYWPPNREFPPYVQKINPGIKNVSDYMKKVFPDIYSNRAILIAAVGAAAYIYYRFYRWKKRKNKEVIDAENKKNDYYNRDRPT